MRCFFCDKQAQGVTRVTDPILLAGVSKKVQVEPRVIGQREYLVCVEHYAALTGRPAKKGSTNGQK